jgi:hypothetical protein
MLTSGEGKGKELAVSAKIITTCAHPQSQRRTWFSFKFGPVVAGKAYAHRDG